VEGDGTPILISQSFAQGENLVPKNTGCGVTGIAIPSVISVDAAFSAGQGKSPAAGVRSGTVSRPASRHYLGKAWSVMLLNKGRD